jgi:hypothetical protein
VDLAANLSAPAHDVVQKVCLALRLDLPVHLHAEEMFGLAHPVRRSTTKVASAVQVGARPDAVRRLRNFPEWCPAQVRDFRPSASVAAVMEEPADFPALRHFPAPQRRDALPVDPALAQDVEVAKVVARLAQPQGAELLASELRVAVHPRVAQLADAKAYLAEAPRAVAQAEPV